MSHVAASLANTANDLQADTTLPSDAPLRAIDPLKCPKRFSSSAAGVPALVVVPTVSPCATSRAVSAQATACTVSLDVAWKRQGMSSSMRLMGWPSRMAVIVAAR